MHREVLNCFRHSVIEKLTNIQIKTQLFKNTIQIKVNLLLVKEIDVDVAHSCVENRVGSESTHCALL